MSAFAPLLAELDRWGESGRTASLWWRDDDASDATPALAAMLATRAAADVPLALATIPLSATPALARELAGQGGIRVWQHGIRHANRAAPPAKKQELTDAGPATLRDLQAGYRRLCDLFGDRVEPVLVPPWNRIAPGLVPKLPALGYCGLSTFKPRPTPRAAAGLWQVNTHADLLDWRAGGAFRGAAACVADMVAHLCARRTGQADPQEPTGLLSHHSVMQTDAWGFLRALFAATKQHSSCAWVMPAFFSAPPEPE